MNPKNFISWVGMRQGLSGWIMKPSFCSNAVVCRRATRNFRGQGSRRQKGHNKKFCVKGISLRLCSLDLETEEIFEAFS